MNFLIADTFTDSLSKLTNEEQKAVKTTAFDLQANPSRPGLKFHRLDRARDRNFWSVRVNRDIRIIVHRTGNSLMLCYVDHHNDAYQWAERRRLETHPRTGAAQLIEIRERVQEILVPTYVHVEQEAPAKPLLFKDISESDLLNYGIPSDFIEEVQNANEDSFLDLVEYLPEEAAETLFIVASGGTPQISPHITTADPLRSSGCTASIPVDDECGGTGTRSGIPLGKVGDFPPSGPTADCRKKLQWPGSRVWLRRHRQNRCGDAPRRIPRACQSRCQSTAHHILRHAGEYVADQTRPIDSQRTPRCGTCGGQCHRYGRRAAI